MQSPLKNLILPACLLATQPALAELTVAEQTGLPEQALLTVVLSFTEQIACDGMIMPVLTEPGSSDLTSMSPVAQWTTCDMAKVVTQSLHPEECLAPVAVNKIDGETRSVSAQGFFIEPGIHTINGRVTLDMTKCQPLTADLRIGHSPDLEVNFEAGNTYYIAYDRLSQNVDEWQLRVWKTEQPEVPQEAPQELQQDSGPDLIQ